MKACPSCAAQVSDKAYSCPSCGHPLRKARRGPMGQVFKWLFILFNLFMVAWLFAGISATAELSQEFQSEAEKAGAAIGGAIGFGLIAFVWLVGDVILGMFVLFTRPKS